ncbi:MAG: IPTL-CTERM sorting domain-containing protein [Saprospiraceae bacterium]|nr:IPTL-CTERM sorting domain-containing protein [Saprospiraceae bacterium]
MEGVHVHNDFLRSYSFSLNLVIDPGNAIPTLSQWGLISLSLIIMVFGVVAMRKRLVAQAS